MVTRLEVSAPVEVLDNSMAEGSTQLLAPRRYFAYLDVLRGRPPGMTAAESVTRQFRALPPELQSQAALTAADLADDLPPFDTPENLL